MMPRATGLFDVSLKPLPMDNDPGTQLLGRMSIDKQFHGDLNGASKGQMLTGGTIIKNSAGYVAIELVTGSLKGRKGSFILQHTGAMNRGEPSLVITVVPDSGTDQLEGLKGTMKIDINAGKHSYELDYVLANFP
ncbi:MAG TPA: DUF3224 domain-containing protein [Gemmatimonadetes bacterium]|nr:DUF3224 domain-containing protein [Gemmatimonadota bacterium]